MITAIQDIIDKSVCFILERPFRLNLKCTIKSKQNDIYTIKWYYCVTCHTRYFLLAYCKYLVWKKLTYYHDDNKIYSDIAIIQSW